MNADMNSVLKILDVLLLYIVHTSQNTETAVCYGTHNPSLLKEKKNIYIKKIIFAYLYGIQASNLSLSKCCYYMV